MKQVIVYGSGCSACKKLKKLIENIVEQNKFDARVEYSQDMVKMAKKGVMSMPAIEIDGEIKASGRVPTREEIVKWLVKSGRKFIKMLNTKS